MKLTNTLNLKPLFLLFPMVLTACSSNVELKYPEQQTNAVLPTNVSSTMNVAKSPYQYKDRDIVVPSNFDVQGLDSCTFNKNNEVDSCPLKKKAIRIYFGDNKVVSKHSEEQKALQAITNERLGLMLENQLAGVNRFRIVTRDTDAVEAERAQQMMEQDAMAIAELMMNNQTLRPDYLVKIDTVKSAERFYAEYNGVARYNLEMTASVIDPFTKEKLSYPNIGKIRVKGTDVRSKESFVYTDISGHYYTGYDYTSADNISAVFSGMASKSFDVLLSRLMQEMPATAQVQAFKNNQVTLDRGRNAGILNNETLILFNYEMGFVEPIAVAVAKPSKNSAIATITRWKDNKLASSIKKSADESIYRIPQGQKIFAVSVGLPADFAKTRL